MLRGEGLSKNFGAFWALENVDFSIGKNEIVGLIGPNGAGKTTLFNIITGVYRPSRGRVLLDGTEISKRPPHRICQLGIARTFQTPRAFLDMTLAQNVRAAEIFGNRLQKGRVSQVPQVLDFVGLSQKANVHARQVSLIERRMLEVAMALASNPRIVLLDEVAAGLNPTEISHIIETIEKIRSDLGISVFWIEHVMSAVMKTSDRIIVLSAGEKIAEGKPSEVAKSSVVIEAYLGPTG